jgi:hypothetical protein
VQRHVGARAALFGVVIGVLVAASGLVAPAVEAAGGCISAADCLSKMTLAEKAGLKPQ